MEEEQTEQTEQPEQEEHGTHSSQPNAFVHKTNFWAKTKTFLIECKRVLKITKKPTNDEFKTIVKISGLGILLIGIIGFAINLIATLVKI